MPISVWLELRFEARDVWVGVYWDVPDVQWAWKLDVYLCVIPFFPLKVMLRCQSWAHWRRDLRRVLAERRAARSWAEAPFGGVELGYDES